MIVKWVNFKVAGEMLGVTPRIAARTVNDSMKNGNPYKFRVSCPAGKIRLVNVDAINRMIEKSLVA